MFSGVPRNLSVTSSLGGAQLIWHGDLSKAELTVHTGLFSRWRVKCKFLQEAGEKKEQFHTSQVLARTHPLTYKAQTYKDHDYLNFNSLGW